MIAPSYGGMFGSGFMPSFGGYNFIGCGPCMPYMPYYNCFGGLFSAIHSLSYTLTSGIKSLFSKNKPQNTTPAPAPINPFGPFFGGYSESYYNPPITPQYSTYTPTSGFLSPGTSTTGSSSFYNPPIVPQISEGVSSIKPPGENKDKAKSTENEDDKTSNTDDKKPAQAQSTNNNNSSSESNDDNSSIPGRKLNKNNDDYGPKFLEKVKTIANKVNCNYRDLLAVMNAESGINASIRNPNGTATGLIQFLESTAEGLGTTTDKLAAMKPIDQLDYVERFLVRNKSAAGFSSSEKLSGGDLYSLVFLPARAKREVLTEKGERFYDANSATDLNNDGKITKDELTQRVHRFYVSDDSFTA